MTLESKIEAILLFKNEPISFGEFSKMLDVSAEKIKEAVENLEKVYAERGIVIISSGDEISFGTHPDMSGLIEKLQKEELSREIGRAGLETLSIILYKGPISRKEIDYIRGVNSGFIVRNLLIRGLIERSESEAGERSFSYKPTLELLRYLGIKKIQELPEFETAFKKLADFSKTEAEENTEKNQE